VLGPRSSELERLVAWSDPAARRDRRHTKRHDVRRCAQIEAPSRRERAPSGRRSDVAESGRFDTVRTRCGPQHGTLVEGSKVKYEVVQGKKGPQASGVKVV